MKTLHIVSLTLVTLYIVFAGAAYAEDKEGSKPTSKLRLELAGYSALASGQASGDYYLSGAVEFEMPVMKHTTLGLRLMPLFFYPNEYEHPDVYGIAAGVGGRVYLNEDNTGVFFEAGGAGLWSMDKFKIDASKAGFLGDCGIGYQFRGGLHLSLKAQHISDAGIGDLTGGTNAIGVGTGFSF